MRVPFGKKKDIAPKRGVPAPVELPREPLQLASDRVAFLVGFTTRRAIESHLGPAIEYPAPGWRTWAIGGLRGENWVLSAIYRGTVLIGVEHYIAKTDQLPRHTPPANGIYKLQPGNVGLGNRITALSDRFKSAGGRDGGPRSLVYEQAFEARWKHGIALVCGNDGRIERIALFANHEMPTLG